MYRNILNTFIDKLCIVKGKDDVQTIFVLSMKSSQIKILPQLADLVSRLRVSKKSIDMNYQG